MSKVRVGIRVSIRSRVSLVLVIGCGEDFPTWSDGIPIPIGDCGD